MNVAKQSFFNICNLHASVPSHPQKWPVTVKSMCLEHTTRFSSFPVLCAARADMSDGGIMS